MGKQSGIGANFYVAGSDLSGDTNAINNMHGGPKDWDTTDITMGAKARTGLLREGEMQWTSFFNPLPGGEHAELSPLPTTDVVATAFLPPLLIGSPAASCLAKLVTYETKRPQSGELTVDFGVQSNGFGLEWGLQLTPGKRTDVAATNGASNNDGAATAFGAQFYLQVFAFTGTDVTMTVQDSADNASFSNVTGGSFAQVTSGSIAQRTFTAGTLRQYVRVITTTVGGFTSVTYAVQYSRNPVAVAF